ncbi:MAG: HEAT repeat domain-containing protein [Nodosilinea sp.]
MAAGLLNICSGLFSRAVAVSPLTVQPLAALGQLAQVDAPANPVLLQPGAEGDEVAMLQRQMRLLGLYQGPVDGRYDGATQAAIAAFQTSADLPASGILDQATWQRMGTPQLLANEAIAATEPPVLFPSRETPNPETPSPATPSPATPSATISSPETADEVATASQATSPSPVAPEGSSEASAEENVPESNAPESNASEDSAATPDNAPPPRGERRLGWLLLGSLALATSLVGWLFLGRGKQRPQADGLAPAPAADVPPSPSQTEATAAAETNALVTTELPLEATTRLNSGDLVDSLVNQLASTDGASRRHAIWELGQRGNSDAIQPLVNGLLQGDSQEKSLILAALAEISSRSLKPMHRALALGLQDPSPEVRKNAIRDLSRVYDTVVQLSHMLAHASQDPDPGVQETAQWALSQLNRIPAAPYPSEPAALETSYDSEGHRLPPS